MARKKPEDIVSLVEGHYNATEPLRQPMHSTDWKSTTQAKDTRVIPRMSPLPLRIKSWDGSAELR